MISEYNIIYYIIDDLEIECNEEIIKLKINKYISNKTEKYETS